MTTLTTYRRNLIGEQNRNSHTEFGAADWFESKWNTFSEDIKQFVANAITELKETPEAGKLLVDYASGKELTPEDEEFLEGQALDIFRSIPSLAIILLPFGSFILMFIVKAADQLGIELRPSAFREYRKINRHALLTEGLSTKDVLQDIAQAALSSGAIVGTGGAGGDVVVDTIFAIEVGTDILLEVESSIAELKELGSVMAAAIKLDFGKNTEAFYNEIKGALKRTVSSGLIGAGAEEFIEKLSKKIKSVISRVVRAISKWVATLMPDDFGLGGPAFQASVSTAISSVSENVYGMAVSAIAALGTAGTLITNPDALEKWLTEIVDGLQGFAEEVDDTIQNPDPEKATFFKSVGARAKFGFESAPGIALPAWALRKLGIMDTDTLGEDYLDMIEYLPSWSPQRKILQTISPKIVHMLEDIKTNVIPLAADIMHQLISWLFAAIAILQMIMSPEERDDILMQPKNVAKNGDEQDKKQLAAGYIMLRNDHQVIREYVRAIVEIA